MRQFATPAPFTPAPFRPFWFLRPQDALFLRKIRAPIKIKSALPPTPPKKGEFYGHGFYCRKNAFFQVSIKLAHPLPAPELRTRILRTRGFFWISSAKKIASEPRFLLRRKWANMVLTAEFPAIPSSATKIASERRCAILVHSGNWVKRLRLLSEPAGLSIFGCTPKGAYGNTAF